MSQATITKSVRLSPIESEELLWLSEKRAMSEAALMKKWISEGIQAEKLEMAIQAYIRQQVDLRSGAIMAGVSYNRFMREVQSRNIVILEDEQFLEGLLSLADAFDTPELRQAAEKVITKIACQNFSATPDLQN